MKLCKECKIDKPESEYYRSNGGTSLFGECKDCSRHRAREWARRRRAADPEHSRRGQYLYRYGISLAEYEKRLADQHGVCAVCKSETPGGRGRRFHVDHDHASGQVRGLLCHGCNVGLGALGDSPDRLMAAAAYLLAHRDALSEVF